ncbi:MAG: YkgJ family cysteine cluster protein [Cyclobacteriaceae bacterium]|nr:YkgJ family cysteine cluster protein [Cyclobacteriaceae bacterium]
MDLEEIKKEAKTYFDKHKGFIKSLKKSKKIDDKFHELHEEVFEEIDCLECANCCKTTSPIFYDSDIERVAKALKMKTADFIGRYLHKDEENDYVLNESPCPFLGFDNKCIVYDSRPKACKEYPHTNRKRMNQILFLTLKNTQVCPAVHEIMKRMEDRISS